jgi:DNA-binding NarL/FixJ family response regulator
MSAPNPSPAQPSESGRAATGSSPSRVARLIIADDHELARAGLKAMLAPERSFQVVGEATSGREAVDLTRRLRPDLALMDMRMPELDGLAATRAIKQLSPRTAVIIITNHANPDYLFEALKAGAAGYVLKEATQREVVTAIKQVLRGESLLNSDLATKLLERLARQTSDVGIPADRLTPREREVLRLLAQGKTNREIASDLIVSVGTVKIHVEHIIAKLGVSDRTQAAVRAVELGLLGGE